MQKTIANLPILLEHLSFEWLLLSTLQLVWDFHMHFSKDDVLNHMLTQLTHPEAL